MMKDNSEIKAPPGGMAVFALIGPSIIWCAEYIGSGEVILATRTGAILGTSVIWAIVIGVFLKYWIGMCGAKYTVCTGEGMIDMFSRMPGPTNWVVWTVLIAQFIMGAISIGSLASAAGIFVNTLIPVTPYSGGWFVTILAVFVVWSGSFEYLKIVMSILILITLIGVFYVTSHIIPDISTLFHGLLGKVPEVPEWAVAQGVDKNAWREILPLIGWGAGGFASQVWYSYWILGAGYGAARGNKYGIPANEKFLFNLSSKEVLKIKKWCRIVYLDATIAVIIGIIVTVSFLLTGAGVLGIKHLAPGGIDVATSLSMIFSSRWGSLGGTLFIIGGAAALISTQIGQMAGWPRLLADSARICIPGFSEKFKWRIQFRMFLVFFLFTNMIIVYTLGVKPVFLVKMGAVLDGLLLTPLQALCVFIGLYWIMPKLFNQKNRKLIKANWIFAVGLILAFVVFTYFCIFQIPFIL